jgi:hypothetical protein
VQQLPNPFQQQFGGASGQGPSNYFGQLAVRMLVIMVSVMIVVAALLYYREMRMEIGEARARNSPRSEKAGQVSKEVSKEVSEDDAGRSAVSTKAAETAQPTPPPASEGGTAQAAETGKHAAIEETSPAILPAAPAPGMTKDETSAKAPDAGGPKPAQEAASPPSPGQDAKQAKPAAATPPPAAPADLQKEAAYRRGVAGIRLAMGKRDPIGAKLQLKAIAPLAQTPEEEAQLARLDTLIDHLREFWKTMAQVTTGLRSASELNVNGAPAVVVEAGATQITLRMDGRNQVFAIKSLPRAVVDALVQSSLPDNAANKVLYGTFLAFDLQGDRQLARKVWQQAIGAGQPIKDFLVELDAASREPGGRSGAGRGPINKTDPPTDPAALDKAEREVRGLYDADYGASSTVPGKLKLAEKLAEAVATAEVTTEARFVMLRDARDYALAAGHPALACQVIDQLGTYFTVDPLEMKISAVEQAAKTARTAKSGKELAECALGLVDEAILGGHLDHAGRLAAISVSAAQRAKNPTLIHDAQEAKQKVDEMAGKAAAEGGKKKGK